MLSSKVYLGYWRPRVRILGTWPESLKTIEFPMLEATLGAELPSKSKYPNMTVGPHVCT